jgi:predicted GTPase
MRYFPGVSGGDRTAVFLGKRGVGKSTTLNRLFDLSLATDPAVECTTKPYSHHVLLPSGVSWRIVDMPGIAANAGSEHSYARYYKRWITKAAVVVWTIQADVRSYKQDQQFFLNYATTVRPKVRLVLAISKIDTLIGHESDAPPSDNNELIQRKIADVRDQIGQYWPTPHEATIVPFSIFLNWNISTLRNAIIEGAAA